MTLLISINKWRKAAVRIEKLGFDAVIKSYTGILSVFVFFFFSSQATLLLLRLLEIMQSTSSRHGTLVARLEILIFFKLTDLLARFVAALRLHERMPKRCLPGRITARLFSSTLSEDEIVPLLSAARKDAYPEIKARDKTDSKSQLIKSLVTRVSFIIAVAAPGMFRYLMTFKN